ncbi:type II/IV secretion system protein [Candidatus Kuenenbacteria bacterium]|nr:type II/IV secretion system protein [Candidatus Kuenenbacteria bacterium]
MQLSDRTLGKILVANKIIRQGKLEKLTKKEQEENISLYTFIITQEIIEREKLAKIIAGHFNVNYINLEELKIDPQILQNLPEIVAKKNLAIVFDKDKNGAHLAINDPSNKEFIENFSKRIDQPIITYFADQESIKKVLEQYPSSAQDSKLEDLISTIDNKLSKAEDLPIIKIVNKLLQLGYSNKASDIHIEPYEKRTLIRFRIDGILHEIAAIPKNLHDLIITRIKILSRLRTDEHRAAQDGRLRFKIEKGKVDVRVSIVPVIYGEKVVMRLLSEKARQYDLANLGFNKKDLELIENNIKKPWGMLLVTGPTGCGKTTTLYSILKILNKKEVNISTIEDPVEYDIEGVNQIQVNAKTNLTFSKGLRAIVRQDPDIIMVGEIRDKETASVAINSAMTGHLVLSTLHTNDAATTLPRLLDMGVKPFLVASTINIAIAQRLVRKICPDCRYKTKVSAETLELINKQLSKGIIEKYKLNQDLILYYGKGCPKCQKTGYKGRQGIFEIMQMNETIKKLIMDKANAEKIKDKAVELGMLPMLEDGILNMLKGVTTIDEILRVTRE